MRDLRGDVRRARPADDGRGVLRAARRSHRGGDHRRLAGRRRRRARGARRRAHRPLPGVAGDGATIRPEVREAVRYAAARVPVAVVSGAFRAEIAPALEGAGLADASRRSSPRTTSRTGKPHPEGYERAVRLLGAGQEPGDVLAFEDTEAGVASAKAAGLRCVGVLGTMGPSGWRRPTSSSSDRRRPPAAPAGMTWVIAHRGASWHEPENTLPAFERAIALGADFVEFDVHAARDGALVVCHDPAPRRAASRASRRCSRSCAAGSGSCAS